MPTGYTAKLYEGEPQTFPEFLLSCARAFGALIQMRDDPMDAPIPDEFAPSPYYAEQKAKGEARLAELQAMSDNEADTAAQAAYDQAVAAWDEIEAKRKAMKQRYEAMLAEAEAWTPPTPDHQGLKDFMVKQLTESIDFDCSMDYWPRPNRLHGSEWLEQEIARSERMVEMDRKHYDEEVERSANRTAWVKALRESVSTLT